MKQESRKADDSLGEWFPYSVWHEDDGLALFVTKDFSVTHEVYFGSPNSSDWPFTPEQQARGEIFWCKLQNMEFHQWYKKGHFRA